MTRGTIEGHPVTNQVIPAPSEPVPDFALRNIILKELRKHPRPVHNKDGAKIHCLCGWEVPSDSPTTTSRARSFSGHQARSIETAVTAWLVARPEASHMLAVTWDRAYEAGVDNDPTGNPYRPTP